MGPRRDIMSSRGEEGAEIFGGCRLHHALPDDARLENPATGESSPFFELLYQADSLKSGIHHPDGVLWIRRPDRCGRVQSGRVPLISVAPTLLALLDLEPPDEMPGQSLV